MAANIYKKQTWKMVEFTCEICDFWYLTPSPVSNSRQACPECLQASDVNDDNIKINLGKEEDEEK